MTLMAVLLVMAVALSACSDDDTTETSIIGHSLTPEQIEKMLMDAREDLEIIVGVTPETVADLSRALTGSALAQTRAGMDEDLAQGRYRKRDYQNISLAFEQYNAPFVEVFAEFDDAGYYVDAATGEQLTQPLNEHEALALSLTEEDGRWKISGIFEPSTESTPRELPETVTTPAQVGEPVR
jgi:hypothetical protein